MLLRLSQMRTRGYLQNQRCNETSDLSEQDGCKKFQALEGNSETGFMRDEYLYGVKTRFAFGYGDWRDAYMHVP